MSAAAETVTGLTFDPVKHEYRFNGFPVISVTQLLKLLGDGYANVPANVLENARMRGEAIAKAIEYWCEDDLDIDSLHPEIRGYFNAFLKFIKEKGFQVEHNEIQLYSGAYRVAGTADLLGRMPFQSGAFEPWVIDVKATYKVEPTVGPQTFGYRVIAPEEYQSARRAVLQLKKDGTYLFQELENDSEDGALFFAALKIHNWRKKHGYN